MSQMRMAFQHQLKTTSEGLSVLLVKVFSGLLVAMTISLIFQEIIGFESLSFVLLSSSLYLGFMRLVRSWKLTGVLVFNLVCILTALLLRMYILIAPGA